MRYGIVTLFPELFETTKLGLLGKARADDLIRVDFANPRDFTTDKHRSCDDTPCGGGSGMVLRPGPFVEAIESLDPSRIARRILLTPQGKPFTQADARRLTTEKELVLVCGRYEGFDERIRAFVDEEISLGDFVLLGGEIAAHAIIEATARLLPGVIGNEGSVVEESHSEGALEYPQYTRPIDFRGLVVPEILRGGNHAGIARWRRRESLKRTRERRPDLFAKLVLSKADAKLIAEIDAEAKDSDDT